jgi:hypothetical protein
MADSTPAQERRARALIGVVAASGLTYPLLVCAVQLVFAQLLTVELGAIVFSVAVVAAVRWGAARPLRSPWLLAGLAPPALYELWLLWPLLTA